MDERELTLVMKARDLASRQVDRLSGSLDRVKGTAGRLGGVLATVGKVGALGLAGIAVAAVGLGPRVMDMAAQLEQLEAKAQTVFADQLPVVKAWADANAEAMGLTRSQATGLAAGFGDLLVPMGFTREQAAKMSTEVVGLSGALAQWSGGQRTSAEVADILGKAMLGERDALKGLGISITENDVQARLAAKGQAELTGAALEQAKAIATQELIFEKSKDAQEAYAKGSAGLMGAQARLGAKFGEVTERIVKGLTPTLTALMAFVEQKAIPAIVAIAGKISAWLEANRPLINQIRDFTGKVLAGLIATIGTVIGWIAGLIGAIARNRDAMNVLRAVAQLVVDVFSALWSILSTVIGTIADVVGLITSNKHVVKGFATVWDTVAGAVGGVVDALRAVIDFGRRAIGVLSDIKLPDLSGIKIPGFAAGGWVGLHGPELVVAGEQGPEYISPRHQAMAGGQGGAGGSPAVVQVVLDGQVIAELVDERLFFALSKAGA